MSCQCSIPKEPADPRYSHCLICGKAIDEAWTSNDSTVHAFLDRLESTIPGKAPEDFRAFRLQCEGREREGRGEFGHAFLARDNLEDAAEEFADGSNYFLFDHLQQLRRAGRDDEISLVLTGAWHSFQAHRCARQLAAKRRGTP